MRLLGRKLLLGMALLVTLIYAAGVPRLWHAHTSADAEHEHSSVDSQTVNPCHSHSHGHSHSHRHHAHGHAHSHSHGPAHSHPPTHRQAVDNEGDSDEKTATAQRAAQWHLHVSLWGWEFTIWGSDVASISGRQDIAQQDIHNLKYDSHSSRDPVEDGEAAVSAVDFDWLAHWDSALILMPLQRSVIELPFDPNRHFAALDDESPASADLQPPVPPPRARFRYATVMA